MAQTTTATMQKRVEDAYQNVAREKGLFEVKVKTFAQQYSQLYFVRLASLLPLLRANAQAKWSSAKVRFPDRILDTEQGQLTCILGTVYGDFEFKPNVLKELASDLQLVRQEVRERYTGGRMAYYLEDDSARIELGFEDLIPARLLLTGVSVAVLGAEDEKGVFQVRDYCFAGLDAKRESSSLLTALAPKPAGSSCVALVSGLNFSCHSLFQSDMLRDLLAGNHPVLAGRFGQVSRLVLAGNSVRRPERTDEVARKKYGVDHARYNFAGFKAFDAYLAGMLCTLPVDLMPGEHDPANASLPQSPFHRGLFKEAMAADSLQLATNPHAFASDGVQFYGTAGQNLDDIFRFSEIDDRLDIAEGCLQWRNTAPTAPDTLMCFPFVDRDPFILTSTPDVFFVGNQPAFQQRVLQRADGSKVLIVLLPDFSQTGSLVLVNTADLSAECINICPSLKN